MVTDVVCGTQVDDELVNRGTSRVLAGAPQTDPRHGTKRIYNGQWYYFCSMACRQKFIANPRAYLGQVANKAE